MSATKENMDTTAQQIAQLQMDREKLIEAIQYFVKRVEAGEIRSTKTYAKYKTLLEDLGVKPEKS